MDGTRPVCGAKHHQASVVLKAIICAQPTNRFHESGFKVLIKGSVCVLDFVVPGAGQSKRAEVKSRSRAMPGVVEGGRLCPMAAGW